MPKTILKRQDVAQALMDWQAGRISSLEIQSWAESLYLNDNVDYEDWEGDEENSITNEILAVLDTLDMNLVLPEDAPIYLKFISTPFGEFKKGYDQLQNRLGQIDFATRRVQLKTNPLYAPFLKD
jgi:hypothetical protein